MKEEFQKFNSWENKEILPKIKQTAEEKEKTRD